jgi:hypothetical protein
LLTKLNYSHSLKSSTIVGVYFLQVDKIERKGDRGIIVESLDGRIYLSLRAKTAPEVE